MSGLLQRRILTRVGAKLAMFAIALHLVLSFAHVHPVVIGAPAIAAPLADHPAPTAPAAPAADDSCANCANVTAIGSQALPVPFILARMTAESVAVVAPLSCCLVRSRTFGHFRSRAPPTA